MNATGFHRSCPVLLAAALAVSGCGGKEEPKKIDTDPALTGALGDQIMVDPDLTSQNQRNAALSGGGPASAEIPPEARNPEAIAAAKAEAAGLLGGVISQVPAARRTTDAAQAAQDAASIALASLAGTPAASCADKVAYSAAWATKLPAPLPVYPRGHVQEAAGTDKDGCSLRVVNFVTPVSPADVLGFYYSSARAGGYDGEHRREGAVDVLGGTRGQSAYVVYVRSQPGGLTEVDLIASGK